MRGIDVHGELKARSCRAGYVLSMPDDGQQGRSRGAWAGGVQSKSPLRMPSKTAAMTEFNERLCCNESENVPRRSQRFSAGCSSTPSFVDIIPIAARPWFMHMVDLRSRIDGL